MARGVASLLSSLIFFAAVAVSISWASSEIEEPPRDPLVEIERESYRIVEGKVGRSLQLGGVAEWVVDLELRSQASGVLTEVFIGDNPVVDSGDPVATIDLAPVFAVRGTVPAFRTMSRDMQGADVAQLQSMLSELGFYTGPVDSKFGSSTQRAVRDWQRQSGGDDDGIVDLGEIIFIPDLPRRLQITVMVGTAVEPGDDLVTALRDRPDFWVPLAEGQRQLIPAGTEVEVIAPDGSVFGGVASSIETNGDQLRLLLAKPDGAGLCGSNCDAIPVEGQTPLEVTAIVVPSVAGPIVPLSGITVLEDGSTVVTGADGAQISVEIVAQDQGLAIVDGVDVGTSIDLLPTDS